MTPKDQREDAPQPEPVAWGRVVGGKAVTVSLDKTFANDEPLYASPVPAAHPAPAAQPMSRSAQHAALKTLRLLGYTYTEGAEHWRPPLGPAPAAQARPWTVDGFKFPPLLIDLRLRENEVAILGTDGRNHVYVVTPSGKWIPNGDVLEDRAAPQPEQKEGE